MGFSLVVALCFWKSSLRTEIMWQADGLVGINVHFLMAQKSPKPDIREFGANKPWDRLGTTDAFRTWEGILLLI